MPQPSATNKTTSLRLALLGEFAAKDGAGKDMVISAKKSRALLAILLLSSSGSATRDRLAGLLWSDRADEQARSSLRQALAVLKKELADINPMPGSVDSDRIAIDPALLWADVIEFQSLARSDEVAQLRRASELYRGELLADTVVRDPAFEEWLAAERRRLADLAIGVFERLCSKETGAACVEIARRLVALDPLREASHRALMQAHAAAGEKSMALQHYAKCRDLLKTELGVTPARETEELRQRILEGEPIPPTLQAPAGASLTPARTISVAVLPFANMSGDPGQDYFADGLADDLSTALAKSRQVSVTASSSTFQYKNRSMKAQDVGRELGVGYVLEGSVRKDGNRIRVTAQLVDAETGPQLWAERFDHELADIFAVQDEIVRLILARLVLDLLDSAAANRRSAPTKSLTAYDYLLRARSAWRRFAVIETRDHLSKAIEADPDYAAGLAFLAYLYSEDCCMQMFGESVQEAKKLAETYVERAIVNDAGDAYAQLLIGNTFQNLGRHDKSRHHLELSLSLNPYYPPAPILLGYTIALTGQHREGLDMIEKTFRLEPRVPAALHSIPMAVHYLMRDYDKAVADFSRVDNPVPYLYLIFAVCLAQAGRMEEAKRAVAHFEARRSPQFDIAGLIQVWCDMSELLEDKEHWLEGFRKLGFQV